MNSWFKVVIFLAATAVLSAAEPVLKITTPAKTFELSLEEFGALPHREMVAADPHGKKDHRYAGVLFNDLLARVAAPLGDKLRGPALQWVVLVHSRDGYGVAFSLAEFDEAFGGRTVLLADREDGQPLPEKAAPLQLVVVGDKRAARWARMVSSIEVRAMNSPPAAAIKP